MLVLQFYGQEAVERIKNKPTGINSDTAGGEEGQVTKSHPKLSHH